jgi:predicted nucleic acid-binding protein
LIYLDTSVALSFVLSEPRTPAAPFWENTLTASRLLEYEVWNRLNANSVKDEQRLERALSLIRHLLIVEMTPTTLVRALKPFPLPVRTLDSLHLATIEYLRADGRSIELASYDNRLIAGAKALGIPISRL